MGLIFHHKQIDGEFIVEMKITQVKKDKYCPEGIKYSLVAIDRHTGKRVLCFDNHERKGHHMHILKRELNYNFVDEWKLIEDFNNEYEKIKRRLLK